MVVHAGVLLALDRPLACDCALWESVGDPAVNSQAAIDPYSLLHAASGAVIAVLLLRYRPRWSYWRVMLIVLFCSTVWEVIENLPVTIAAFGYEPGDPLRYTGDSLLNSLGDSVFAMAGAGLAFALPAWSVVAFVVAGEIGLSLVIGDGYVIGLARALGALG